jgi:formyl-CoA transferase
MMLAGLRVLDLGTMITGPLAAMILGDMGAEVIKVEPPEGDPFRSFAPDGYGPHFLAYNRGKRSVVLDLRSEQGRAALAQLVAAADVLVENYRPGTLAKLGFPPEVIAARHPRLVHCAITGFGADGPYAKRPAYDGVAQSYAGVASLFLDAADPKVMGPTVADNVTGYTAALAVLGALVERGRTGRGRRIEVNMLEATMAFAPDAFAMADRNGTPPGPLSRVAASQTYTLRCADGALLTIHMSAPEKFWTGLLAALEAPELATDPRFTPRPQRVRNYVALRAELATRFAARPRAEWMERLAAQDVPHAPVLTLDQVAEDPQVRHLAAFATLMHPAKGVVRGVQPPWRIDGARQAPDRAPPLLGEHTAEVLADLGMGNVP